MRAVVPFAALEPPRVRLLVPRLVAAVVASFALTLLVIVARSPYTHGNLAAGYDPSYTRTEQIRVGPAEPYPGIGDAGGAAQGDAVTTGARLFVTKGCVACHALQAAGGPVAPPIVGASAEKVGAKTHAGPGGMPRYTNETLTDGEVAAIAAYLQSLKQDQK